MNFFKLLNFETNRFWKPFAFLAMFTAVFQLFGLIITTHYFMEDVSITSIDEATYAAQYGKFDFNQFISSFWFAVPILMCFTILMLYIFVIWYREWFGKSSFIYRLLMLPTARITVYTAKLCTILLYTFGLLAWQIVLVVIERIVAKALIPATLYSNESNFSAYLADPLNIVVPITFTEFLLLYGFGIIIVVVLFTAILFERSYRLKGILFAVLYGVLATVVLFLPSIIVMIFYNVLFPDEILLLTTITGIIVIAASVLLSRYLLKYKVTV